MDWQQELGEQIVKELTTDNRDKILTDHLNKSENKAKELYVKFTQKKNFDDFIDDEYEVKFQPMDISGKTNSYNWYMELKTSFTPLYNDGKKYRWADEEDIEFGIKIQKFEKIKRFYKKRAKLYKTEENSRFFLAAMFPTLNKMIVWDMTPYVKEEKELTETMWVTSKSLKDTSLQYKERCEYLKFNFNPIKVITLKSTNY
jgi:hypothetical protein